jgi:hypothetical protein
MGQSGNSPDAAPAANREDTAIAIKGKGAKGQLYIYSYLRGSVSFTAYLSSYSDSFSSSWAEESVYGRMDPIPTFQNTQRKISVSFIVKEVGSAMEDINTLFKMLYPGYETTGADNALTLNQAPLVRVKFNNLISKDGVADGTVKENGLLGYISSLSYTPQTTHAFIATNKDNLDFVHPKFVDLSFSFTVLHEGKGFFDKTGFPYGPSSAPPIPDEPAATEELDTVDGTPSAGTGQSAAADLAVVQQDSAVADAQ